MKPATLSALTKSADVHARTHSAILTKAAELRLFALSDLDAAIERHAESVTFKSGRGFRDYTDPESAIADAIRCHLIELKHDLEPMILRLAAQEVEREAAETLEEECA